MEKAVKTTNLATKKEVLEAMRKVMPPKVK
jgi:hypothetical protein